MGVFWDADKEVPTGLGTTAAGGIFIPLLIFLFSQCVRCERHYQAKADACRERMLALDKDQFEKAKWLYEKLGKCPLGEVKGL